jgi:hypothetical protein
VCLFTCQCAEVSLMFKTRPFQVVITACKLVIHSQTLTINVLFFVRSNLRAAVCKYRLELRMQNEKIQNLLTLSTS